jgi:hypothetical protein
MAKRHQPRWIRWYVCAVCRAHGFLDRARTALGMMAPIRGWPAPFRPHGEFACS